MSKVKILTVVAIGLLVINLVLMAMMVMRKHPHHHPGHAKKVIIEKLQLDKGQQEAYQKLIDQHRADIQLGEQRMSDLKNELYMSLHDEQKLTAKDSLLAEISHVQWTMENVHYNHFLDIKGLCKPEQMKAFGELTHELANLFALPSHAKARGNSQ